MPRPVSGQAFMHWRVGEPIESEIAFAPLGEGHPCYDTPCVVCRKKLGDGQRLRLRVQADMTSSLSPEATFKYLSGQWINAPVDIIHNECASTAPQMVARNTVTVVRRDA